MQFPAGNVATAVVEVVFYYEVVEEGLVAVVLV